MAVRIAVDPSRCRGALTCITFAGDLFLWPEGGEASTPRFETVDDEALIDLAEEAAESCPTAAITVVRI
jgi:ferredoxin